MNRRALILEGSRYMTRTIAAFVTALGLFSATVPAGAAQVEGVAGERAVAAPATDSLRARSRIDSGVVSWHLTLATHGSAIAWKPGTSLLATTVDTSQGRPRAIEHSDAYYTRLTIHKIGSYTMLPLFAGEYYLGQKLLTGTTVTRTTRDWHRLVADGLGALFAVNTVTGVWNLIESRKEPAGRPRRLIHAVLMLASDAGFAYVGSLGGAARRDQAQAIQHRNWAIASISASTVGTLIMWLQPSRAAAQP